MSQPYVGEIRAFGFQFAPSQWAYCNGQPLAISQFDVLFTVIGTTYGGDGVTTFNVPDLQGRAPMHWGTGASGMTTIIGQVQGVPLVTLTQALTPQHTHTITVQAIPSGGVVDRTAVPGPNSWISDSHPGGLYDYTPTIGPSFASNAITTVGGSQPHENMQPYLALNFCIALFGIFPSRN